MYCLIMRRFARTLLMRTNGSLPSSTSPPISLPAVSSCFDISSGLKVHAPSLSITRFLTVATSSSEARKQVLLDERVPPFESLNASYDAFGGVVVDMKGPMDSNVFVALLKTSISQWTQQGKKGVWIKLPIESANLVEAAVKEGFWYHHAEPTYLMLVYWIPNTPHSLPANASHRVGIGAFVMNPNGEILVVQEKYGRFKGKGFWKLPTGAVDEGEDICRAAIREVKEEAGIEAEFEEIIAIRQGHKTFFEKSDLFFVCMLRPLSYNIQKQSSEIAEAKWMPLEEYAAQPLVQNHGQFNYISKLCFAKKNNEYSGFSVIPTTSGFSARRSCLYAKNQGREQ